ncbi:uncharacterized protein LOC110985698 [Acanthaster planci]|uniref:Uncharacterized protein LOC110985698 n=1 Tax=Acanthaster planci TaxID=133434 RepID=A0A8B7ZC96_ACAPL|nr:uncharacterized protein LOC110985698 [Acanthaster planci]
MSTLTHLRVLLLVCGLIHTGLARLNPELLAIAEINQQYKAAMESGDMNSILAPYSENILFLPNGHQSIVGKDKLASYFSSVLPRVGRMEYNIKYLDYINQRTGLVLELLTVTVLDKQGNVTLKGRTLLHWKWDPQTRGFKVMLEMINSDQ